MLLRNSLLKILASLALISGLGNGAFAVDLKSTGPHINSVSSYREVFGEGQKLTAVILEFDTAIESKKLSKSTFTVEYRTVEKVYSNVVPERSGTPRDGKYVVVELSLSDKDVMTTIWGIENQKMMQKVLDPKLVIRQVGPVTTVDGKVYPASSTAVTNGKMINPIVDDFQQFEFHDPKTGVTVRYNLFIPKNYDKNKSYPMVMFIHDRGALSTNTKWTLFQGLGAVSWASPADQAKHESFVLAPQYDVQVVDDDYNVTPDLDATVNLIGQLKTQYNIDPSRIYTTGQSMGCMMSIVMNVRYPDLFAASLLVSGQWDPKIVAPMATKKIWITVSEGDDHAFPGMNAITDVLATSGGKVAKATWDATSTPGTVTESAAKLLQQKANVYYVAFKNGTVHAKASGFPDNPDNDHRGTWQIVYGYPSIRDWIFAQRK